MNDKLVKWKPSSRNAQKIDTALARIRGGQEIVPARSPSGGLAPSRQSIVTDLPRVCAIHGKPWSARYVMGGNGRWKYAQSIAVTEFLYRSQYAGNERQTVPGDDIGDERCAWCGASGHGSVLCTGCGHEVCYGGTVWNEFRCCCGHAGRITLENRDHTGVVPRLTGW